jgi:hypothetical protein
MSARVSVGEAIDTRPDTFLEQARQTIIGGAKESLLHCYDYLGTTSPGIAVHGKDLEIKNGLADAEAFRQEAESLRYLADILAEMEPYGVLVPKKPNVDSQEEAYLPSFIGMLGVPVFASASLAPFEAAFLGMQAAGFENLSASMEQAYENGRPLVVTLGLLRTLEKNGVKLPANLARLNAVGTENNDKAELIDIDNVFSVLRCPAELWELMNLAQDELDQMRNKLLKPFGIEFFSPAKVSLHLFRSDAAFCEVIENFNDSPVKVQLKFNGEKVVERKPGLALPQRDSAKIMEHTLNSYVIELKPRSMLLISTAEV